MNRVLNSAPITGIRMIGDSIVHVMVCLSFTVRLQPLTMRCDDALMYAWCVMTIEVANVETAEVTTNTGAW